MAAGRDAQAATPEEGLFLRHLLRAHGLGGIAALAIAGGSLELPDDVGDDIRRDWGGARAWAATLDRHTEKLAEAAIVAASGWGLCPPILLKGPAVARRYSDPSVRTYADIDLLVEPRDLERWACLLTRLGFRGPATEMKPTVRREQHALTFELPVEAGAAVACDLHTCLLVEPGARDIGHGLLLPHTEQGPHPGLLMAKVPAQLLVLALHLAHHPSVEWRLIWLRDFLELGSPEAVEAARGLAAASGMGHVLEYALAAAEGLAGCPIWQACSRPSAGFGLERVHRLPRPGYLHHVALARDLGPAAALRYVASRVDPRRFADDAGVVDWRAVWQWWRQAANRTATTPWLDLVPQSGVPLPRPPAGVVGSRGTTR